MRKALFIGAALLCIAGRLQAQVEAGLNELNVSAHFTGFSGDDSPRSVLQLTGALGHFFTRRLELGGLVSATKVEDVDLFGALGAFGAYHFGMESETAVPFVGGQLGFGFGSGPNPFNVGAFAGIKFFLTEGGALTAQAVLQRSSSSGASFLQYGLNVGISIFFR